MNNEPSLREDWDVRTIGDVTQKAINGGTPERSEDSYWDGDIEWLSSGEIGGKELQHAEETITQKGLSESSAKVFPVDSVLVAMYGDGNTKGRSVINREEISGNQAICCLVPKREMISEEYLLYYIKGIKDDLRELARGGGQDNLNQSIITGYKIPVPPLAQQETIINTVEDRISKVENLRKSVEVVGDLIEEYENSLQSFLFSGKDYDSKNGPDQIPDQESLPDDWELKSLKEVANVNPRISLTERDDFAYVPMDAVSSKSKTITRYERRNSLYSGLAKFSEGDLLIARITPCFENGKVAKVGKLPDGYDYAVGSSEFVVIRPENISQEYLYHYLQTPFVKQWGEHRLLGATGRERIKVSQFRNELTVPAPPVEKQSEIVDEIKRMDKERVGRGIADLRELFDEYRSAVLKSAFDPTTEPSNKSTEQLKLTEI